MKNIRSFFLEKAWILALSIAVFPIQAAFSARINSVAIDVFTSFNQSACRWLASQNIAHSYFSLPEVLENLSVNQKKELGKEIGKTVSLIESYYKSGSYLNRLKTYWLGVMVSSHCKKTRYRPIFRDFYDELKKTGELKELTWMYVRGFVFSLWNKKIEKLPIQNFFNSQFELNTNLTFNELNAWRVKIKYIRSELSKPSYLLCSLNPDRENLRIENSALRKKRVSASESLTLFFQNFFESVLEHIHFDSPLSVYAFFHKACRLSENSYEKILNKTSQETSDFVKENADYKKLLFKNILRIKHLMKGGPDLLQEALFVERLLKDQALDTEIKKIKSFCDTFNSTYVKYHYVLGFKFVLDALRKVLGEAIWSETVQDKTLLSKEQSAILNKNFLQKFPFFLMRNKKIRFQKKKSLKILLSKKYIYRTGSYKNPQKKRGDLTFLENSFTPESEYFELNSLQREQLISEKQESSKMEEEAPVFCSVPQYLDPGTFFNAGFMGRRPSEDFDF
jgi:hypothetical protein